MKQDAFDDSFGVPAAVAAPEAEEGELLASILVPNLCNLRLWNSISSTVHTEPCKTKQERCFHCIRTLTAKFEIFQVLD